MIPDNDIILLDTCILVYLIRYKDKGQDIERKYSLLSRKGLNIISQINVGEIIALSKKLGWGDIKLNAIRSLLNNLIILDIGNEQIIKHYAEIDHYSEKIVKPARQMGQNDMWIAATTMAANAWLLTTDKDFDHLITIYSKIERVL